MTEISKTSHGLKGLMAPDTVSTEVDIHQDGVDDASSRSAISAMLTAASSPTLRTAM